ncbi:MAG TPA: VIT domain-containing protein, partial [Chthoniobacterales bacterium]
MKTAPVLDPLRRFVTTSLMPLLHTRIEVRIRGGLAVVATERLFRNGEPSSIEATITFPVPVHATLVRLTARIDGRDLVAIAMDRSAARDTYEDAIDRGKTTVLHEEVLRGVHQLSVGHVPPGAEVTVC